MVVNCCFFFLMIRRPPRSTQSRSSAASDVYKRQPTTSSLEPDLFTFPEYDETFAVTKSPISPSFLALSLIHISEPTRLLSISYAVFCLKKKKNNMPL